MQRRTRFALVVAAALVVVGAVAVLASLWLRTETTLEFSIRDVVSGKWVWNAVMRLQDRLMVGYYQSDAAPITYRFTHLQPGKAILEVAAEGYQSVSLPVTLKRGRNRLEKPIDMVGLAIPDLARFYIFAKREGGDIRAEIRPVSSQGEAILNHPCMDLWIGCRVSVQVKDGVPAREEVEEGSTRGPELFRGQIPWVWDPAPETQFRYTARIPVAKIREHPSAYRVIDFIVVEPDPLSITRAELEQLMARVFAMDDLAAVSAALDAEKGRLRYFVDTSWNVKAGQE
jgi:hypothetical protein